MREILPQKSTKAQKFLHRHAEGWSGVAALAVFECEIATKRSLAIVTRETRRAARGDKMLGCSGRTYLACLGRAGCEPVTVIAG
jgi:hypothetical protein